MVKLSVAILLGALLATTHAQVTQLGQYPAHVGLNIVGNRFGEGVILNINHVLTVASNVFDVAQPNVRLAANQITVSAGQVLLMPNPAGTVGVQRIYAHDHYNFVTGKFNVAVLRTANFIFPDAAIPNIAPATLHTRIVPDNSNCDMVGFLMVPQTQNRQLNNPVAPVLNRNTCNLAENGDISGFVFDQNMCVGGMVVVNNNCGFNDGAGYYCNGELVGLRTRGFQCGIPNSPGVLLQVRWFQDWIQQQFNRTDDPQPGPVPPPGVSDQPGTASTIILSTLSLVSALFVASVVW